MTMLPPPDLSLAVCVPCRDTHPAGACPLTSHRWAWDESSSGRVYQFCTRCLMYRDDCLPNEHHDAIPCPVLS